MEGIRLRQAAVIAGFAYLLSPVSYIQSSIWPKLVIAGDVEQTVRNLQAHNGLFVFAILGSPLQRTSCWPGPSTPCLHP
jgi:hypothetical protein